VKSQFVLLSVLLGLSAITVLYFVGKTFFNARVGLVSSLLLGVSSIHILVSEEVRAYTLLVFTETLFNTLFWQFVKTNRSIF